MKKEFIFSAIVAATLTACSSDLDNNGQSGQAIGFSIMQENATRGLPITSSNIITEATEFEVFGYKYGATDQYVGTSSSAGITIQYDNAKGWDYKTATDRKYWPGYTIDFYAINPASNANITDKAIGNATQSFKYEAPVANANQIDLLYAAKINQGIGDNAGKVPFIFKHALSQIVFRARTVDDTNLTIKVKSITIHNVKSKGTFTFKANTSTAADGATSAGAWSDVNTVADYAAGLNIVSPATDVTVDNTSMTSPIDLTAAKGALLLIPQTLTAWATTATTPVTITTANTSGSEQSYLEIECIIASNSTDLVGTTSTTTYGKTYVPFGTPAGGWVAGTKYIYTLNFGVGYKDDGTLQTRPITYTVTSVEDWNPVAPDPVDLQ